MAALSAPSTAAVTLLTWAWWLVPGGSAFFISFSLGLIGLSRVEFIQRRGFYSIRQFFRRRQSFNATLQINDAQLIRAGFAPEPRSGLLGLNRSREFVKGLFVKARFFPRFSSGCFDRVLRALNAALKFPDFGDGLAVLCLEFTLDQQFSMSRGDPRHFDRKFD